MIRLADVRDASDIQTIYAPIVRDTAISFELEPPSAEEIARRIAACAAAGLPWLVHERAGDVLGYVYAGRYRGDRPAYQWSCEVSVYVRADSRGTGVGRGLYTSLFAILTLQGFRNAYAGATLPNPGSVRLHESLGFESVGIYRSVGYKMGAWHDVIWWARSLAERTVPPEPPTPVARAINLPGWSEAIAAGEPLIRVC